MSQEFDRRPDPDALLVRVNADEPHAGHGRLKVFLGAAAGVGKTFAMLEAARIRRREGVDVVVGLVETHGRRETEALLEGLEQLPRRATEHRAVRLEEFDLDAALARRPHLLLVDELAHTNAPGSRHSKRWQDVDELLGAGIDVYTTLNVQHLESLNDVISRITHVRVRETVPDSVLERADELELVDLPPEELLKRLAEGKVYIPEQARRAAEHFFRKGNLIALRQLALRRAAERVDAQMRVYRRAEGVVETWPVAERIVVGIGPAPSSQLLVRATKRMADQLGAEWIAAFVETPDAAGFSEADRTRVWQTLRLAEELGGRTATINGSSTAEILGFARAQNATRIVVGKPTHARWRDRLFGSKIDRMVRASGDIDVIVISGGDGQAPTPPRSARVPGRASDYIRAAGAVTMATGLAILIRAHVELANIIMLYLLVVGLLAARFPRRVSVAASVLSVAAFDYFCVPPYLTLRVADTRFLPVFAVMLLVALVISTMTTRLRRQAVVARQAERRTSALFALSEELADATDTAAILEAGVRHVAEVFDATARILLPDPFGVLRTSAPAALTETESDAEDGIARWVLTNARPAGMGTDTLPSAPAYYLPLLGGHSALGILAVRPSESARLRDPEQLHLLETIGRMIAASLERARLAGETHRAEQAIEMSRLKSEFVSTASHELRTPLSSLGLALELLEERVGRSLDPREHQILAAASGDALRLRTLLDDLLDLARLESGRAALDIRPLPVPALIMDALESMRLQAEAAGVRMESDIPENAPPVAADRDRVGGVLVNLISNALHNTPAGGRVVVSADVLGDFIQFAVADNGRGIPIEDQSRIFDGFVQLRHARGGTGLGLAIARQSVRAHGGEIWVDSGPGPGSVFSFTIPVAEAGAGAPRGDPQ